MTEKRKRRATDVEGETIAPRRGRRGGDGGIYLVVYDETEEFSVALRYAARLVASSRARLGVLHVINLEDFQHWNKIEDIIKRDQRAEAEKKLTEVAKKVNDLNGHVPAFYVREGIKEEVLVEIINEDMNIKMLILGGGTHTGGPGPLVSHFTGKGLGRLRVPVVVVPGHLDPLKIDSIT
jgi:nucleotide-binding universal stress UspA family protein